jgi:hypothetical protein
VFLGSRRQKGKDKKTSFLNKGGALGSKEGSKGTSRVDRITFYYPILFYYIS